MDKRRTDRQLVSRQTFFNGNVLSRASALSAALAGALALVGAVDFSGALTSAPLYAQSIINQSNGSSNRFGGFSTQTIKKVAMREGASASAKGAYNPFAEAERERLDLPAPQGEPKQIDELTYRMPFSFPKSENSNAATSVDLLCSDDQGQSWIVYDSIRATESRKAFQFVAPNPGEYWFALKTSFKDGKIALSSTRAYRFGEEADDFSLRGDELSFDDEDAAAPPLLSLNEPQDDALFVEETSAQSEDAGAAPDSVEQEYETPDPNLPRVGKLKTASFAKEAETGKLLVVVRWFKADEIEEQYRGVKGKLTIEHGPTPNGPWEPVGTDLSLEENGYSWYATELDMDPFYIRLVVTDENGKSVAEVSSGSLDANHPDVRKALEPVKTPVPFKDIKVEKEEGSESSAKKDGVDDKKIENEISMINKTSAEKDEKTKAETDDIERTRGELKTTVDKKSTASIAPRRERPRVPAPTNPNQIEVNPLFTRGVSVLYRSAQTRYAYDEPSSKKRSIFTPPSQAAKVSSIPPAQQRRTAAQIAMAKAREAREKMEQEAKYAREHEMEMFDQKPELMEGRVFYMDENGNMTTTPPASFLQAQNNWQLTDVGEPITIPDGAQLSADGQIVNGSGAQFMNAGFGSEAEPPIYMPTNTDDYDASARSGAATLPGNAYMPGEGSSSSPLNQRYAPTNQTPGAANGLPPNTTGAGVTYQSFPQTSYSQSFSPGAIPYNFNANRTSSPANFPPRPSVTR